MAKTISVVINTLNEAASLERALKSASWADEILVCDMRSDDQSVEIAKRYKAKVVYHQKINFVEPARNFAISKASGEWVLIIDPDEEIPSTLATRLRQIVDGEEANYVNIPRKNIIFGKWMKYSGWWPDYNIRFFKKGSVTWQNQIHSKPICDGNGLTLPPEEEFSLIHHNYNNIAQFLTRMDRYTNVQAEEIDKSGYKFNWIDLIEKPLGEFLSRFFAQRGFEDGAHGLLLSLLQASSYLIMYAKVWEKQKFIPHDIKTTNLELVIKKSEKDLNYWLKQITLSKNPIKRVIQKIYHKLPLSAES